MGAVYLAEDKRLAGKQWAVKEMLDQLSTSPEMQQKVKEAFEQEAQLLASDGTINSAFGVEVSFDGQLALIGASQEGNWKGSAYVFRLDGTTWVEEAKLTASDGVSGDWFGHEVVVKGDIALIGAEQKDDVGAAYVFRRNGTMWTETTKLNPGELTKFFGISGGINDNFLFVGATNSDIATRSSVYTFDLSEIISTASEVPDRSQKDVRLEQNYPNPVAGAATITYELPQPSMVSLTIYDILGREVKVLVDGRPQVAGKHEALFETSALPNGTYVYRLVTDVSVETKILTVLR